MALHREAYPSQRAVEEPTGDGDHELPADAGAARSRVNGHELDETFAVAVDLPGGVAGDAAMAVLSDQHDAPAIHASPSPTTHEPMIDARPRSSSHSEITAPVMPVPSRSTRAVPAHDGSRPSSSATIPAASVPT